jgi:hypothetical protein
MPDPGTRDPAHPEESTDASVQPLDPRLVRRLFIAFVLIVAIAIASAIFLPRAGLSIPWYLFALVFLAIVAAAMAPLFEGQPPADDTDDGDTAGRIGPGGRE